MTKYRPSKSFVLILIPSCTLIAALGFGLFPILKELQTPPVRGEIIFRNPKPLPAKSASSSPRPMEWIEEKCENLMTWERNPWKRKPVGFGDHYFKLRASKDPLDQAKCRKLERMAEAWHPRLLLRFPELAVPLRNVPDERNGFLKWLDFQDKYKKGPNEYESVEFPKDLDAYLNQQGVWNYDSAMTWVAGHKPVLDQIRAIGLMTERSANGIPVERWGFIPARLVKSCEQALVIEARLAAETGDAATALESIRAAKGLAGHFSEIETPTLLAGTVQILIQVDLEQRVLHEILPALPAGTVNPAEWESILKPTFHQPAEFARLMKGEWSASCRQFLLPMLLDAEDPQCPPEPGELLDAYSMPFVETVRMYQAARIEDLPTLKMPSMTDTSHLSRASRKMADTFFIGSRAWQQGWERSQSSSALSQAAFAILKSQPIPKDPVYGQDYRWDPATRQLSMPAGKAFDEMKIKPITVPKL